DRHRHRCRAGSNRRCCYVPRTSVAGLASWAAVAKCFSTATERVPGRRFRILTKFVAAVWGADVDTGVALRAGLLVRPREGRASPCPNEQDRPCVPRPVSECRGHPGWWPLFSGRTRWRTCPFQASRRRCRRGKEQNQLEHGG